jgi:hypothetical protein
MPQVVIETPEGRYHRCDSSDPELLGRWFLELINREGPDFVNYEFRLRVWPLWNKDKTGQPVADWSVNAADNTHDLGFFATLDSLIAVLTKLRDA